MVLVLFQNVLYRIVSFLKGTLNVTIHNVITSIIKDCLES